METLKLWIGLNPEQLAALNQNKEVFPDEHSGRFGLRTAPDDAVNRAQYFMDWSPEGLKGEYHQKNYVALEMGNLRPGLPPESRGWHTSENEADGVSLVWAPEAGGS